MLNWESQKELARALCTYPEACRELVGVLTPACFGQNQAIGWIAQAALETWRQHRAPPTEGLLREYLETNVKDLLLVSALERLPDVLGAPLPPAGWAVSTGRHLAATARLNALQAVLPDLAEEGRFDEILSEARKAALLAAPAGELTTGSGTEDQIRARQTETGIRIPTGIEDLDRWLSGGLKKGEMGHVLGKKGGGKSHTLTHVAGAALRREAFVLYASLEMSEPEVRARVDRHIVGGSGEVFFSRLPDRLSSLRYYHSRLAVLTRKSLSVGSLVSAMERLETRPDVVIVDYLQLMSGGLDQGGKGELTALRRMALGRTSQELHDVAQEHQVALWTAYQANRLGIQKMRSTLDGSGVLDVTDYAEAIDAAWPAAVIVSVNQSLVEAASGRGRLFLAENRGGPSSKTVPVELDWSTSTIRSGTCS